MFFSKEQKQKLIDAFVEKQKREARKEEIKRRLIQDYKELTKSNQEDNHD